MGVLNISEISFSIVDPQSPGATAAMMMYFAELDSRFTNGFDPGDTLDADSDNFREPNGCFVLGLANDETVCCGGITLLEPSLAEIKRMWVTPQWRGRGVGRLSLTYFESVARDLGASRVVLDTNDVLDEAISLYLGCGYSDIEAYNTNPYARRWFMKTIDDDGPKRG